MKYYSYNEPGDNGEDLVITKSEDDIRKEYYPYWLERMYGRFGKEYVDENYCFQDCLIHWICVNWAWEITE